MNYKRLITVLALLIFAASVQAQSGRRQTKPIPAAPVPTPTPEPTPTPKKDDGKPELIIVVAKDSDTALSGIPLSFQRAAQQGCADRLRGRSPAEVDEPNREMNRGQASDKAKHSTNTYVVLLAVRVDSMATSSGQLQVDYVLFAAGTGKVLTTGRAYVNQNRAGPVILGPTSRLPSGVYREQWLREAGEEAADRVLKKLNLNAPK